MSEKSKKELNTEDLNQVTGGYVIGSKDKYTQAEYNKYGVTWQSNVWSKDKYFYQGREITQDEAENIVHSYKTLDKKPKF